MRFSLGVQIKLIMDEGTVNEKSVFRNSSQFLLTFQSLIKLEIQRPILNWLFNYASCRNARLYFTKSTIIVGQNAVLIRS